MTPNNFQYICHLTHIMNLPDYINLTLIIMQQFSWLWNMVNKSFLILALILLELTYHISLFTKCMIYFFFQLFSFARNAGQQERIEFMTHQLIKPHFSVTINATVSLFFMVLTKEGKSYKGVS